MAKVPEEFEALKPSMKHDVKLGWIEETDAVLKLYSELPVEPARSRFFHVRVVDGAAAIVKVWKAAGWELSEGVAVRLVPEHRGVIWESAKLGELKPDEKQRVRLDRGTRTALGVRANGDVMAFVRSGKVLLMGVSVVEPERWDRW